MPSSNWFPQSSGELWWQQWAIWFGWVKETVIPVGKCWTPFGVIDCLDSTKKGASKILNTIEKRNNITDKQ
jgi:hypothetical protein